MSIPDPHPAELLKSIPSDFCAPEGFVKQMRLKFAIRARALATQVAREETKGVARDRGKRERDSDSAAPL